MAAPNIDDSTDAIPASKDPTTRRLRARMFGNDEVSDDISGQLFAVLEVLYLLRSANHGQESSNNARNASPP